MVVESQPAMRLKRLDLVGITEAARHLGVHPQTLRRWDRRGWLTADLRIGLNRYYNLNTLAVHSQNLICSACHKPTTHSVYFLEGGGLCKRCVQHNGSGLD